MIRVLRQVLILMLVCVGIAQGSDQESIKYRVDVLGEDILSLTQSNIKQPVRSKQLPNLSAANYEYQTIIAAPDISRGWQTRGISAGSDIDDDGHPEIIITDYLSNNGVHMYELINGQYEWVWSSPKIDFGVYTTTPRDVAVLDLDGNGREEIVFSISGDGTFPEYGIHVYEWDGATDNGFNHYHFPILINGEVPDRWFSESLNWGDPDQDGQTEILFANNGNSNQYDVFMILSFAGTFSEGATVNTELMVSRDDIGFNGSPWAVIESDLDGDGYGELLMQVWDHAKFIIYESHAANSYDFVKLVQIDQKELDGVFYRGGVVSDVNHDGRDEFYGFMYYWSVEGDKLSCEDCYDEIILSCEDDLTLLDPAQHLLYFDSKVLFGLGDVVSIEGNLYSSGYWNGSIFERQFVGDPGSSALDLINWDSTYAHSWSDSLGGFSLYNAGDMDKDGNYELVQGFLEEPFWIHNPEGIIAAVLKIPGQMNDDSQLTQVDEHTILYARFDESDGEILYDDSGNENHGFLGNLASTDSREPQRTDFAFSGKSLHFQTDQDLARFPFGGFDFTQGTVSMLVYLESEVGDMPLISITNTEEWSQECYHFMYREDTFHHHTRHNNDWTGEWNVNINLETDVWNEVVFTWSGSNRKIFFNGDLVGEDNSLIHGEVDPTYWIRIGDNPDGSTFHGYIDEVKISDVDRSTDWTPSPTTIAHWKFDEGSGSQAFDQSGNSHHGTLQNGASWSTGITSGAVEFDGIDDYINVNSEFLWGLNAGTIEVILKPDIIDSDNWFFAYAMDTNNGISMCVDGNHALCYQFGTALPRGRAENIQENNWYHVALTWDGNTVKSYVNGILDREEDNTALPRQDTHDLLFGADSYFRDQYSFDGIIDEIRISSGVLEPEQFLALGRSGQSAFFNGPAQGSRMRILNGSPINENANPEAYQINGTNITVEAWVYPLDYPAPEYRSQIAGLPIYPSVDPWQIYGLSITNFSGTPKASFTVSTGQPGSEVWAFSSADVPTREWTHIAGTYDGSELKIYMNGELQGSTSTNISIAGDGGDAGFFIGRFQSERFFGLIDEVRLWNTTRAQTEIRENMFTKFQGNESGLAGYWPLDGTADAIDIAVDKTANHNDLIIQRPITFTAIAPGNPVGIADISDYPASIDFGAIEQATLTSQAFNLTNTSSNPFIGVGRIAGEFFREEDMISGFIVPPKATEQVSITFSNMGVGAQQSTLTLEGNMTSQVSIPVSIQSIALQNLDINNTNMWVQRDGRFARDPFPPRHAGFEWPQGSGLTAVYASGLWLGAKVNGEVRTSIAQYEREYMAGNITNGQAVNPDNLRFRVYKIQAGDDESNLDYAEWPADLGAPVTLDGKPLVFGQQMLYHVYNDQNPEAHFDGAPPLGAEVQQLTFGYNMPGSLENTVLLGFRIINKSNDVWKDAYLSLWCDPDIGHHLDDLLGVDTIRNMVYAYNGDDFDEENSLNSGYGSTPPAIGYKILKGAFYTKPMQAAATYADGFDFPYHDPSSGEERYRVIQGQLLDGSYRTDPGTGEPGVFPYAGDPVSGEGWIDSDPGDRRFIISTGPFNMDPGQSKVLFFALVAAQGSDRLSSITTLRDYADELQSLFQSGAVMGSTIENVRSLEIPANTRGQLDEIANAGVSISMLGGDEDVTVEVATYSGNPLGLAPMENSGFKGVGSFQDVQVIGENDWPVVIKLYYTDQDLLNAGITESELAGVYYWSGRENRWIHYSESGQDDQGRGLSSVIIVPSDIELGGVNYSGYVGVLAYHLNPMILGAEGEITASENSYLKNLPDHFSLRQNYPNPFNPTTTILYGLPESSNVSLILYDISGRRVKTLVSESQPAGWFDIEWNGTDDKGRPVGSGTYIARIQAGSFIDVMKMVYLK
ncbi:MAG: FG-GAP-like repeat-containing protein [Candidatus Marinimicrobia bacterium]|nr:FG-GAP-like repeat-containing protein [Candidatus Neomarinimicrobiota bacterium]